MYQPILKGKKGELDAWGKVSGAPQEYGAPIRSRRRERPGSGSK